MTVDELSFFAFPLTPEQRRDCEEIVGLIRGGATDGETVGRLIEVILELTRSGLWAYFVAPLEAADAGFASLGVAKLGVRSASRGLPVMIKRVIRSLSPEQLQAVAAAMEKMIVTRLGGRGS